MVSKKYTKDYRLENTIGKDGKIVTVTVYCGEYYGFIADKDKLRRARAYIVLSCLFYWVFFWLGLAFDSGSMRQLYVSLPYFIGFLPAVYLSSSVYYLVKYTRRPLEKGFTREQHDRVYERMAQSSFVTLLLAAFAAVGVVFYFIFKFKTLGGLGDILTVLSILIMLTASALVFVTKKYAKMQALS